MLPALLADSTVAVVCRLLANAAVIATGVVLAATADMPSAAMTGLALLLSGISRTPRPRSPGQARAVDQPRHRKEKSL